MHLQIQVRKQTLHNSVLGAYLILNQYNGRLSLIPHLKSLNFTLLNYILYKSITLLRWLEKKDC